MSRNESSGIFGFNSLSYQLIKTGIVFICVYIITIINRKNADIISNYCSYYTMFIAIIFFLDNCFIRFSGNLYYRLWWLILIHIAAAAVYLAVFTLSSNNFRPLSIKLTKGYTILYIVSFVSVFLRPIGDAATKNFIIGKGTLSYISYLLEHPAAWDIWFITLGNIIFFIPIPFILKVFIPEIKAYHQLIIAVLIPVFIEGYQFIFKCGDVDIDDLVLNFSGFAIGLILMSVHNKIKKLP